MHVYDLATSEKVMLVLIFLVIAFVAFAIGFLYGVDWHRRHLIKDNDKYEGEKLGE